MGQKGDKNCAVVHEMKCNLECCGEKVAAKLCMPKKKAPDDNNYDVIEIPFRIHGMME
jgi:hypothetical protein